MADGPGGLNDQSPQPSGGTEDAARRRQPVTDAQEAGAEAPLRVERGRGSERLPVLAFFGRGQDDSRPPGESALSALVVGAVALVVALMVLTIAIGRTPQEVKIQSGNKPTSATPTAPTSYTSPEPTGKRWTAEPIITGVPQKPPSYEPIPTPTPSEKPRPGERDRDAEAQQPAQAQEDGQSPPG